MLSHRARRGVMRSEPALSMTWPRALLRHAGIPFVICGGLLFFYYGGAPWTRQIVSPTLEGVPFNSQREFGLLENLQHLLLAGAAALFAHAAWRFRSLWCGLAGAATLFLFCEEIDYGSHWFGHGVAAVHNRPAMRPFFHRGVHWGTFAFFGLFALFARRFRRLAPEKGAAAGVLIAFGIDELSRRFRDRGLAVGASLQGNEGEFFELALYLLVFNYARDLHRRLGAVPGDAVK